MDAGDDRTKDTEGRMDREAGVERGSETTGSKTDKNLGQRPREEMRLFGDTVDQRRETRDVAADFRIGDLSSPRL